MTECNQSQFEFEVHFSRRVVAEFSGERLTTEGGALLLRATDRKIGLLRRVVSCFTDARDPQRVEHELSEMLVQRVVAKAEQIEGKENPRYLVTSLGKQAWPAQNLYEQLYCARGEMENRIKEQLSLFSDRLSTETLRANQLRLYFSSLAYVLLDALRRLGLTGTEWAEAQVDTIRLKLLKIAAQVRVSARRIWIRYSSAYPWQNVFAAAYTALRC
jgi:hypothetical protein